MSTQHFSLIAAVLALGLAGSAAAHEAPQTGVGVVIAEQGNQALQRIRSELAAQLRQNVALPQLAAPTELSRSAPASGLQVSLNP